MQLLPDDGRNIVIQVELSATLDVIREDRMKPEGAALFRQRRALTDRCRFSSMDLWEILSPRMSYPV